MDKKAREQWVAERFCALLTGSCYSPCKLLAIDDAPDAHISAQGQDVYVELANYRDQGSHNASLEKDEALKQAVVEEWLASPDLQFFTPNLQFHERASHFSVPTKAAVRATFVLELKELIRAVPKSRLRQFIDVQFVKSTDLSALRKLEPRTYFVATEAFPTLSTHCTHMPVHYHAKVRTLLPTSSLNARYTGVDRKELTKIFSDKLSKLPAYRKRAGDRPVWLLIYSLFWPSTSHVGNSLMTEKIVNHLQSIAENATGDRFDAVWWGNNIGEQLGELHPIYQSV